METTLIILMILMLAAMVAMGLVIRILLKTLLEQMANELRARLKFGSIVAIASLILTAIALLISIFGGGQ